MKYLALGGALATGCALAAAGAGLNAAPPSPADGISYTVKPGDTLSGIADKYLNHTSDHAALQRGLGLKMATRLQPGTTVIFPRALLKSIPADAQLVAFRGAVLINQARPDTDMIVHEGARIDTAAGAFATLILSNGSKITLPSQTSVRLTRLRKFVIDGSLDYEVTLATGQAEAKATHFNDRNSRFQIRTPFATSAVRGTEFRIAYAQNEASGSLTEVLGGSVAVGAGLGGASQLIAAGIGARVSKDGATHTEQLLPAPQLTNAGGVQKDDVVHLTLSPIANAVGYRIQLAHDAGFVDVFDDVRAAAPQADFSNVPDGNQFARTTALSASGFEGLPATSTFVRKLNSIHATVEAGGHGGFRFKWTGSGTGDTRYRFQLSRDKDSAPLVDEPGLTSQELELTKLEPGQYRWRVGATKFDKGEASVSWTDEEVLNIPKAR